MERVLEPDRTHVINVLDCGCHQLTRPNPSGGNLSAEQVEPTIVGIMTRRGRASSASGELFR
jgi:hypothetical protein